MRLRRKHYSYRYTTPATAVETQFKIGFVPKYVCIDNITDRCRMEWWKGMARDSAIVTLNTAGTASVGTIAVNAANTGGGTSPATAGTYTGKTRGTVTLVCTKAGDVATAELTAYMPDGKVIGPVVTGASTVAKAIAQGITFAITAGTGSDLILGDSFTTVVVPAGSMYMECVTGISVGKLTGPEVLDKYIKMALNTKVNVAEKVLNIYAR